MATNPERLEAVAALHSVARPKQARSERTLLRLLDAAERLIEERGHADASIPEIARRAGSSIGGFYARFRDKRELLLALEERFFARLGQRVEQLCDPVRWRGAPASRIVAFCVEEMVATFQARHALIRAFVSRAVSDPDIREEGVRFRHSVADRFAALLLTRRREISHPEPEVALHFAVELAFGLMHQQVLFGPLSVDAHRLDPAQLASELSRDLLAYLGIRESRAHRSAS